MKKKISWPAYKALLITGVVAIACIIPLALVGIIFIVYRVFEEFMRLMQ